MSLNKTQPRPKASVEKFLASVENEQLREDCKVVHAIMSQISGDKGMLWGTAIVGFGSFTYICQRKEQTWMRLGFSPRKSGVSVYLSLCSMDGFEKELKKLGKHKAGKGCLNIRKLEDVNVKVLEAIIQKSWNKKVEDLASGYSESKKKKAVKTEAKAKKKAATTPKKMPAKKASTAKKKATPAKKKAATTEKKTVSTTKKKAASPKKAASSKLTAAKKKPATKRARSASAPKAKPTKKTRKS